MRSASPAAISLPISAVADGWEHPSIRANSLTRSGPCSSRTDSVRTMARGSPSPPNAPASRVSLLPATAMSTSNSSRLTARTGLLNCTNN
ncbi:hypothetical protein [Nocardia wallacei]|uniref:hypothetical protein n=1 Tax=Nocardia wallacei TaxID=480035 RepID=UPI00245487F2|nr:hypothetical protein [Nocardia wallacei]